MSVWMGQRYRSTALGGGTGGGRRMGREGRRGQGERGGEASDVAVIINYDLPPVAIIIRQISSNYIFMKRSRFF